MFNEFKKGVIASLSDCINRGSLLKIVQAEKKTTPEIKKILRQGSKQLWFSTWEVLLVVASFFLFLFLLHAQSFPVYAEWLKHFIEWFAFYGIPFALTEGNHYQNLIAIHAGIGAVLIGLAFFIAQEIAKERDKGNSYKGFVILSRSKFFPLLLAEILSFFLFLWGSVNILSVVPILLIGLATIYSLYKTFEVILGGNELEKEEKKIFLNKLTASFLSVLDLEITKFLGGNELEKQMKDYDSLIQITPFSPINKKAYIEIKSSRSGIFRDLNLRTLKKLLGKLKEIAPIEKQITGAGSGAQDILPGSTKSDPYCYLSPRFYSDTKEVGDTLFWIRKDLLENKEDEIKIRSLAQEVFKIRPIDFDLEQARDNIRKLRLLSLDLIKDKRADELRLVLNSYIKLIEYFYIYLEPYGGGFSEKQARDMSMEIFFGGFNSIAWISEDIQEIFEQGIKSSSKEIIGETTYLLVRLMRESISRKDHLILRQFQYYPIRLYQTSVIRRIDKGDDLSGFIFDRSWRYLKEIVDHDLEVKLKKEEDYPVEEARNFACAILKIFQSLLKDSFEKRDIESFKTFLSVTRGLFRSLDITDRFESTDAEKTSDYLRQKKEEMLFGVASWIFFKLSQNNADETIKQFYDIAQEGTPSKIEDLTNIFLRTHDFGVEGFWGWDNWEMSEKGEGQVHSIQILEKLEKFYIVRFLILLAGKTNEEIAQIKLPHTRDSVYLAEDAGGLIKTLDNIAAHHEAWAFILSESSIEKIDILKDLLKKAKEAQEQSDVVLKRKQNISQKRVQEFKKVVIRTFDESASLRDIFIKYIGTYEEKIGVAIVGKKERFGINIIDDKASFFDNWHIHYSGWGENYGRDLAAGENSYLLDEIAKDCEEVVKSDFELTLSKIKNKDDVVLLATNMAFWRFFEDSKKFMPKWHRDAVQINVKGFAGWYDFNGQQIPVFEIYHRDVSKRVLILDKTKIGKLVQLSPLDKSENSEDIEGIFYIDIQEFSGNVDLMKEIMSNPPKWLNEIGDEIKQREYLEERVRIKIFERFEFKKSEKFKGYKLLLTED